MLNIVITGTSQGIGLEFTKECLEDGHRVMAIARPSSHLQELQQLKEKFPQQLSLLEVDLLQPGVFVTIQKALQGWKHIDVLINNAGIYGQDDSLRDFTESFHVNSIVPYFMTKSLLPLLKSGAQPKVIFISSQMGSIADNSSGGAYAYRSSKAALNMLGKCFSLDEKWLTTLIFHPGWVHTRMGGEAAPVRPADAVAGMLKIIYRADKTQSGSFVTYQGKALIW